MLDIEEIKEKNILITDFSVVTSLKDTEERREEKKKSTYYESYPRGNLMFTLIPYYNSGMKYIKFNTKTKQIQELEQKEPKFVNSYHLLFSKRRKNYYYSNIFSIDNIKIICNYKAGDIIKKYNQYYKIVGLKVSHLTMFQLVIENLVSLEQTEIPFVYTRPVKIYTLSDRIKNRLASERETLKLNKKKFEKELIEKTQKAIFKPKTFSFGFLQQYKR